MKIFELAQSIVETAATFYLLLVCIQVFASLRGKTRKFQVLTLVESHYSFFYFIPLRCRHDYIVLTLYFHNYLFDYITAEKVSYSFQVAAGEI